MRFEVAGVGVDVEGPKKVPLVVLGHGAGGTMETPLLRHVQQALVGQGYAAARYNFPYTEKGRKAPDRAPVLINTVVEVTAALRRKLNPSRTILGGKSMGGRMASMAVADGLPADGLVFLGYPLHPMGKPDQLRKEHLFRIRCPMLFISGTRDKLAQFDLLEATVAELGAVATLVRVEGADHGLERKGLDTVAFVSDAIVRWAANL